MHQAESKASAVLEIQDIQAILPHRYPFLLVDRVLECDNKRAVGIKNVTNTEFFFPGHFPAKPVMPGVLIAEALAQLSGIVVIRRTENKGKIGLLAGMDEMRFREQVVPGDQLRLEVEIVKDKQRVMVTRVKATVDGRLACEGSIMIVLDHGRK